MKKNILLTGCLLLALTSCYQAVLDPLQGVYPAPTVVDFSGAGSCEATKVDGKRYFELNLSEAGTTLVATLVGDAYYLTSNAYTEAEEAAAKKGNFILGKTSVNGTPVKTGTINITQDGDAYRMKAVLFLSDGTPYKMTWSGNLSFDPDPEPVRLTQVFTAQSNLGSGVQSVTLSLGTDGISSSFDMATYQTTWSGDGNYLAIDLYSADGYLHEGTYTASAVGGTIGEGEFGIGYDAEMWGMKFENWGTCWWTVTGGATSAEKILSGTITVEKKGSKWVITWGDEGSYPKWAVFEGAIDALLPPDLPTPQYTFTEEIGTVTDATWAPVAGVESHTLTLVDASGAPKAYFSLILAEGATEIAGTYTCKEYASEPYAMGNGFSFPEWGMEGGTRYYDDTGALVLVNPGETLEVIKYAEGLYGFEGSSGYGFVASTGGFTPGGDTFDGTLLTTFLGLTDYSGWGMQMVGVELSTDGITVTPGDWGNTYGGSGNYLKLELYSTDGKIAAGQYTACAVGGTIGEGEFGIGYDGMFGASGTSWYTLTDGTSSYQYVTDGTLKVEVDGDVYTIVLESSVINAKYVGKLSAE